MSAAILFPGQGAQTLGMGLDVAEVEPAARAIYERGAESLGLDLRDTIAGGDAAALDRTDVCQPAILLTSLAVLEALAARKLLDRDAVTAVAGLSLGEYSALAWAGALDLEAAVKLVRLRGEAMQRASEANPSGMLSLVGATAESAAALCDAARGEGVLVAANYLAPHQIAISGTTAALERAAGLAREHGVRKAVPLSVAGAFHSPCMESAAVALAEALDATEVRTPSTPVVMNVTGEPTTDPDTIRALLKRQVTSPVRWQASMDYLLAQGVRRFLEPAPGRQLTNMLRRYDTETEVAATTTAADLDAFAGWPGEETG